jgi:FkbM family methyltransferase
MSRPWRRWRFDLVEILFVGLFLWLGARLVAPAFRPASVYTDETASSELRRLEAAYGPSHYSQFQEEWIVRDFFKDRRGGFFVDVGANHYRDGSTTFYLEQRLGWSGVAIDPQAGFEDGYRRYRPRTRFFPFFVSDVSNQTARLYMSAFESQTVSARRPPPGDPFVREMDAPTITLTDLFDRLGIRAVDFLSVDVELAEPKVLAGLDAGRFRPELVCIEAHPAVRQEILDFFARHAYVVVGKYLRVDTLNLYFTPAGPAR